MLVNPDKNIEVEKLKVIDKFLPNSKIIISFSKSLKNIKKNKL
jgi:hypothetical protein